MPSEIQEQILAFYGRLASDPNHRYRSWEHCYGHFRGHATFATPLQIDTAALYLAFYLASWGMYRGSSALLQKDYRIHQPAVSKLLEHSYDVLWDLDFEDSARDGSTADLIISLSEAIKATYRDFQPTDTLLTKILLGTVGCAPACDQYFIIGFRRSGHLELRYSQFDSNFLCRVFRFCRQYKEAFREAQEDIAKSSGIRYPLMKLADMYFWNIGFSLSAKKKAGEISNEI
jgi:hypothetical protein